MFSMKLSRAEIFIDCNHVISTNYFFLILRLMLLLIGILIYKLIAVVK